MQQRCGQSTLLLNEARSMLVIMVEVHMPKASSAFISRPHVGLHPLQFDTPAAQLGAMSAERTVQVLQLLSARQFPRPLGLLKSYFM